VGPLGIEGEGERAEKGVECHGPAYGIGRRGCERALIPRRFRSTWQSDRFSLINAMRLTSLADYAVVMMAAAARHPAGARLSAGQLAEETGVPLPTAQKLMGRLAATGLLSSARGTGGGFRLAREAAGISLADIVEAVEGPIAMTTCADDGRSDCAIETNCRVKPHLLAVNDAVRGALQNISLASLASPPAVRPEPVEGPAFSSSAAKNGREGFDRLSPNGAAVP
jgi:FeS assembly SUF system regulator